MKRTTEHIREIKENEVFVFFRRGKHEHINALYEIGELYINTIDHIRSCDENWERSDPEDGITHRKHFGEGTIKICDVGRDINKEGISMKASNLALNTDHKPKGNIYCLSGIYSDHLLGDREDIDFTTSGFGDSLIVIYNPKNFLERVKNTLTEHGYPIIKHDKIQYYANEYSGEVGIFKKHEKFKNQSEFRIFIPNPLNQPIKINIGSLKDIAAIEKNNCLQFTYTDDKKQLMKLL